MTNRDWHSFDIEHGYDARQVEGGWQIRRDGDDSEITDLTDEEFEQLRTTGDNPKGL